MKKTILFILLITTTTIGWSQQIVESVLSIQEQRSQMDYAFSSETRFSNVTIIQECKKIFENTLNVPYTIEGLKTLALDHVGNSKFRDRYTGEVVTEEYIYKHINIQLAKDVLNGKVKLQSNLSKHNKFTFAQSRKMTRKDFTHYVLKMLRIKYASNNTFIDNYVRHIDEYTWQTEFEYQRLKKQSLKNIQDGIALYDYDEKFHVQTDFTLGNYNFDKGYYPIEVPKDLYKHGYYHNLDDFKIIGMGMGGIPGGFFYLYALNRDEFNGVVMDAEYAENLLTKIDSRRNIYTKIIFSTTKLPVVENNKVVSMMGFIEKIEFYADRERRIKLFDVVSKRKKSDYDAYKYVTFKSKGFYDFIINLIKK